MWHDSGYEHPSSSYAMYMCWIVLGTAHEMFPCYDLLNEGQRCQPTAYSSYPNTCKTNGYMLAVFRSEEHYKLTYKARHLWPPMCPSVWPIMNNHMSVGS